MVLKIISENSDYYYSFIPFAISCAIASAVSKASFIVVSIVPIGPLLTHPLQYNPV